LAKEAGLSEGKLIGFLGDTHIYINHVDAIRRQIARVPKALPQINTPNFTSIFDWHYGDTVIENYDPHPAIKFEIAV
jgi:thymidylate synthase